MLSKGNGFKKCLKNFANPLSDGYTTRKNIPIKNTNQSFSRFLSVCL